MVSDKEMLFVYSEMQINEDRNVSKKLGRNFTCGNVYVGSVEKQFSKIINPEDLDAMFGCFPDTKVVYRGKLSKTKYTDIKRDFITETR